MFIDYISRGTIKVKLSDADLKVIAELIVQKMVKESCEKNEEGI